MTEWTDPTVIVGGASVVVALLGLAFIIYKHFTDMKSKTNVELERQKEKTRQQTEQLTAFKLELIDNYKESEYNGLHAIIEPSLRMNMLKNEALEELLKKGFPESWNKESEGEINCISKSIKDINRAINYRDRLDPWKEPEVVCRNFCNLDCPVSHPFNLRP